MRNICLKGSSVPIVERHIAGLCVARLQIRVRLPAENQHIGVGAGHIAKGKGGPHNIRMENPYVKVIGHPDDSRYPLNYERVVLAAKKNNVALEVNNSSLNPGSFRIGADENATLFLKLCKENNTKIIFGSDAHISFDVGAFHNCLKIAEKVDFPKELIVNYNEELINELVGRKIL